MALLIVKSLPVVEAGKIEGHEYSTASESSSQENENDEIRNDDVTTINYNFALKEVISNALNSGELKQVIDFLPSKNRALCKYYMVVSNNKYFN